MGVRGKKKASIKDVAEKSGFSTATVSHVINGTRYVSEEVSQKVKVAMKELNYTPNPIARSLRSHQSHLIGLIIPVKEASDTANLFFMTIAQGIEATLSKNGYKLILCNSHEDKELEKEHIEMFDAQLIDGLIIAPTADNFSLHNNQYPVVFIDRKPKVYLGDCILANNFQGAYDATQHIIRKGHKKIGLITGELGITTSDHRKEGYKKALLDESLEYKESYVKEGKVSFESGYQLAKELVEQNEVSSIFIANNTLTLGALSYFQEKKIHIPDELAIIGFDDYEWTKIMNPPLTCVKQPAFEIGQKAAEVILARISNKEGKPEEYLLDTTLTIRKSC